MLTPSDTSHHAADLPGWKYEQLFARFDSLPPLIIAVGLSRELLDALDRRGGSTQVLALEPLAASARQWRSQPDIVARIASGRLTLLGGPDYEGRADAWKLIDRRALNPPMIVSPRLQSQCPNETAGAKSVAKQIVLGAQANEDARKRFAGRYLLNTLTNLPTIAAEGNVSALVNLFADTPAIVVGAGPSLDDNVTALRALQDRAVIIAVDTAVRPLLAAGIKPHLVVAVDPGEANARHLAGLPDVRGMWLATEGSIHPSVLGQFAGRTFVFKVSNHHPWPWLATHKLERETLQAWGSVLTTAFDLAVRVGCNPIVFAGADLSYTGGIPYCRNTVYEAEWAHFANRADMEQAYREYFKQRPHVTTPDLRGADVLTTPHFLQFRDWLVAQSQAATTRRIVNATGAGILHGGRIEDQSLQSFLTSFAALGEDPSTRLATAWTASTGDPECRARLERALGYGVEIPLAPWYEFGSDTTSPAQIAQAAQSASGHIASAARRAAYLARCRDSYNRRAVTLQDARTLSHGNYDVAARRASAQQAHVLLDFMQRTYPPAGHGVKKALKAFGNAAHPLRALDVGCGVGRSMEALVKAGVRVDGVDISERMLQFARQNKALANSEFFLSRGDDCGCAPDGAYDLVYSLVCFRYVSSRHIRSELLRAMTRAVKPNGVVVVEMRFFPAQTAASIPPPHVPWHADHYELSVEAGEADVQPTPDELPFVYEDFSRYLKDVRLQFVEVSLATRDRLPPQLFISGSPIGELGLRVHAE